MKSETGCTFWRVSVTWGNFKLKKMSRVLIDLVFGEEGLYFLKEKIWIKNSGSLGPPWVIFVRKVTLRCCDLWHFNFVTHPWCSCKSWNSWFLLSGGGTARDIRGGMPKFYSLLHRQLFRGKYLTRPWKRLFYFSSLVLQLCYWTIRIEISKFRRLFFHFWLSWNRTQIEPRRKEPTRTLCPSRELSRQTCWEEAS